MDLPLVAVDELTLTLTLTLPLTCRSWQWTSAALSWPTIRPAFLSCSAPSVQGKAQTCE